MKKHSFAIIVISMMVILVTLCIIGIRNDINIKKNPPKPTIIVKTINATPRLFFKYHENIMMKNESVIYNKYIHYDEVGENKWIIKYKYVYILQGDTREEMRASNWFSRDGYLKSHPMDAVDKKLIFSNNLPDTKIFNIKEVADH